MKGKILTALILLLSLNCQAQRVNTFIGTASNSTQSAGLFGKHSEEMGQTMPAVLEPHGMTFWTPQTRATEVKCVCPYYYKDSEFMGIRASHWISGGCTQDYGSFTLMPTTKKGIASLPFSHEQEYSSPTLYRVQLPGIQCEMIGRSRSAIFRLTYDDVKNAAILLTVNSDEQEGSIEYDANKHQIRMCNPVHRIYQGWGEPAGFSGYAIVQLPEDAVKKVRVIDGKEALLWLKRPVIMVKMSTSFTSYEGAEKNLNTEIPNWDFEEVHQTLEKSWDDELWNRIQVQCDTTDTYFREALTKFQTALYHTAFLPHVVSDVDNQYASFARSGIKQGNRDYYDDFSAWDTYRALHPLLCLITPNRSSDMMQSLVNKYEQGGWLPIFPCWGSYTAAMIGDHCSTILADAYVRGIRDFDIEKAYEGMRKNSFETPQNIEDYKNGMGRRALQSYLKYGYIPLEDSVPDAFHTCEQVSRTLEYALDDYALAQVARLLGHKNDYQELTRRSGNWQHVFGPTTGWANGKHVDGSFDKNDPTTFARFITEGTPCHYSWYVPQDIPGLIRTMGGRERFAARLDSMFDQQLYWHGNEPCHQIAYLYNYIGQPQKTQQRVRHILEIEYNATPGGLSGNDDAGQMSAWFVFSALGFYPVCPATNEYALGAPLFPRVDLNLENGKTFSIIAHHSSQENCYVQRATLNGKTLERPFIRHEDILAGGTLEFEMGCTPSDWGTNISQTDFNPMDYGAKGDGVTDDTKAIQTAINEAAKVGTALHPSTFLLSSGHTFLCGPLELKGNIDYHLENGSRLLANPNEELYRLSAFGDNIGEGMLWLWANGAEHITFSGQGILDGNGIAFMGPELEDSYTLKELSKLNGKVFDPRPHLLTLFGCNDIEISGITIQNGAYWTVHLVGCTNAKIHDMSLLNQLKVRNGDGIDLDHTQHVKIWNCHIESGDDCICLKNRREYSPGYSEAMNYLNRNEGIVMRSQQCGDIEVWNCVMTSRSCSIKIGSENMDSISHVWFHDCAIHASNRGLGIQNRDEGTVSDVLFENIKLDCHLFSEVWWGQAEPIYVTSFPRAVGNHKDAGWRFPKGAKQGRCGEVSHITFRNIQAVSENGCYIGGDTPEKVNHITLDNISLTIDNLTKYPHGHYDRRPCVGEGFIQGDGRKIFVDQSSDVSITNCK